MALAVQTTRLQGALSAALSAARSKIHVPLFSPCSSNTQPLASSATHFPTLNAPTQTWDGTGGPDDRAARRLVRGSVSSIGTLGVDTNSPLEALWASAVHCAAAVADSLGGEGEGGRGCGAGDRECKERKAGLQVAACVCWSILPLYLAFHTHNAQHPPTHATLFCHTCHQHTLPHSLNTTNRRMAQTCEQNGQP